MTTTELIRHEDQMRMLAIPKDADAIWGIAERMHAAGLVPSSIKSVECAFLAMMKGAEYGLLPQQALAGFYVIGNIAHPYGTCLNGIARAAQSHEDEIAGCIEGIAEMRFIASEENEYKPGTARHEMFRELQRALRRRIARVEEKMGQNKDKLAYFCGWSVMKRKGCDPVCMLWDTYEAQRGGLATKDMWTKWTTRMYMHRAATFNRRDTFADALMGLEATYEEMIDVGTQPDAPLRPATPLAGAPSGVLERLSQPAQPAAPVAPPKPTGSTTPAEMADIYMNNGKLSAPASDIPLESEEPTTSNDMPDEPGKKQTAPKPPAGRSQLREVTERLKQAGLDPVTIGKEIVGSIYGEGVTTKDLSDAELGKLASAMAGKLEDMHAQQPENAVDEDPANF